MSNLEPAEILHLILVESADFAFFILDQVCQRQTLSGVSPMCLTCLLQRAFPLSHTVTLTQRCA